MGRTGQGRAGQGSVGSEEVRRERPGLECMFSQESFWPAMIISYSLDGELLKARKKIIKNC